MHVEFVFVCMGVCVFVSCMFLGSQVNLCFVYMCVFFLGGFFLSVICCFSCVGVCVFVLLCRWVFCM